jgi:hypothetical protein
LPKGPKNKDPAVTVEARQTAPTSSLILQPVSLIPSPKLAVLAIACPVTPQRAFETKTAVELFTADEVWMDDLMRVGLMAKLELMELAPDESTGSRFSPCNN